MSTIRPKTLEDHAKICQIDIDIALTLVMRADLIQDTEVILVGINNHSGRCIDLHLDSKG